MKRDWSQYRAVALLPFLAVALVYVVEASSRRAFFVCEGGCCESIPANVWQVLKLDSGPDSAASDPQEASGSQPAGEEARQRKATALRYGGRMAWYLMREIYLFVCAAAWVVAAILVAQLWPRRRLMATLVAFGLSLGVGLFLYTHPQLHMAIFVSIFEHAIAQDLPAIAGVTNAMNCLGNAAMVSLLFAACATLLAGPDASVQDAAKQLARRTKALRTVLYSGTLLLVATMLLKKSIYQWALAYTSQHAALFDVAQGFVANLLTIEGGFYTLVLAATYLPAAAVLQRRANLLPELPASEAERQQKLKEYGLTFSFTESLPRVLAVLGPMLVGPVGELFKALPK